MRASDGFVEKLPLHGVSMHPGSDLARNEKRRQEGNVDLSCCLEGFHGVSKQWRTDHRSVYWYNKEALTHYNAHRGFETSLHQTCPAGPVESGNGRALVWMVRLPDRRSEQTLLIQPCPQEEGNKARAPRDNPGLGIYPVSLFLSRLCG